MKWTWEENDTITHPSNSESWKIAWKAHCNKTQQILMLNFFLDEFKTFGKRSLKTNGIYMSFSNSIKVKLIRYNNLTN